MSKYLKHIFSGSEFRKKLIKGALGSMAARVMSALLMLLVSIILARVLGPVQLGVYSVVLSLLSMIAVPAQMGLCSLIVRETAKAHVQQDWGLMRGLWRWTSEIALSIAFPLATLTLILGKWLLPTEAEQQTMLLLLGALLIPLNVLVAMSSAALRGLRHVVLGQLPEFVLKPLLLAGIILGMQHIMEARPYAITAMGAHTVAAFISFCIGMYLLWYVSPKELRARPKPVYENRAWLAAALPMALTTGLQVLNQNLDIMMLGLLHSVGEVGIYKVAVSTAAVISLALGAVNMVLAPHFVQLYERKEHARLQRLVTVSSRGILAFALPFVLIMVLAGEKVLTLLFGVEYASGKTALSVIALGQFANASMGSVGLLLNMTGHERKTISAVAVAAITNVVLNIILIPDLGAVGAAIAAAVSLATSNVIMWYAVRRQLGIETMAFFLFPLREKA